MCDSQTTFGQYLDHSILLLYPDASHENTGLFNPFMVIMFNTDCIIRSLINPFHVFPGPCPGILILITMPIPDRVRASLQLIHCMLNSRQVWPDASSVLQNIISMYYSAFW